MIINGLVFGHGTMLPSLQWDPKNKKEVTILWHEILPIGSGNKITKEQREKISSGRPGTQWIFKDVKAIDIVITMLEGARKAMTEDIPKGFDFRGWLDNKYLEKQEDKNAK